MPSKEEIKEVERNLNYAICQRNFWERKVKEYEITLKAIREFGIEESERDSQWDEWDCSYLQEKRNGKAYGRLALFKWYIEKMGGRAHRDHFRKIVNQIGDSLNESAWNSFLAIRIDKKGLVDIGDGYYILK